MATPGITLSLEASVEQAARAFKNLARVLRPFMGKAALAGYYIENRRGRNRLVPFKKGTTNHDRR